MRRMLGIAVAVLIGLAGIGAVAIFNRVTTFEVERVTDDVSVIFNAAVGGNVGVLRTELGAVIVDTMTFRLQGQQIRELAERLGGGPTQAIINTHYHQDHTHGNPAFAIGARFVATQRTRDYLVHWDSEYRDGDTAGTLPNEIVESSHEMRIGGKTVRSYHLGAGHTGGDLAVLFVEDRVLHTGDLLFNHRYPSIDIRAGGSVREWDATIDRMLELDFDTVIPGHGQVTDREGIVAFQRFLRELWREVGAAVAAGKSLEETLASVDLNEDDGYESISIPFVRTPNRDRVIGRVYAEVTGKMQAAPVPRSELSRLERGTTPGQDTASTAATMEDRSS